MLRSTVLALLVLAFALPASALASPAGDLDTTFGPWWGAVVGTEGVPGLGYADGGVDSVGRIVTVGFSSGGSPVVRRHLPDGTLDADFGDGGSVAVPAGGQAHLAVGADDSVYVGGTDGIVHLQPSGAPDPSFSSPVSRVMGLASTPAGLLAVLDGDGGQELVRLTASGAPDAGFGDAGAVALPVAVPRGWNDAPLGRPLAVRPDGSIVVAGSRRAGTAVAAYTATGDPVGGFGVDGVAGLSGFVNGSVFPVTLAVGAGGDLAGVADDVVFRMTAAGQPDPAFAETGTRRLDLGADRFTSLSGVVVEGDGNVTVSGSIGRQRGPIAIPSLLPPMAGWHYVRGAQEPAFDPGPDAVVAARLTPAGAVDCRFGDYGLRRIAPPGPPGEPGVRTASGEAAAVDGNRLIVLGGSFPAGTSQARSLLMAFRLGSGDLPVAAGPRPLTAWAEYYGSLTGWVDPRCGNVTAHFEYGPTAAYGSRTPDQAIEGAAGPRNVSAGIPVQGLSPGEYHFRLVATGPAGSVAGEDRTFTVVVEPEHNGGGGGTRPPGGGDRPPVAAKGRLLLRGSHSLTVRDGRVRVAVTCRAGASCRNATVTLRHGARTLGSARVTLRAGQRATVTVRLRATVRAALRHHRSRPATLTLRVPSGRTDGIRVTLRRVR